MSTGIQGAEHSDILASRLQQLREIVAIQCSNGNWNYDAYMHGLANGLLMAVATMANEECKFMDAPDRWLSDVPIEAVQTATLIETLRKRIVQAQAAHDSVAKLISQRAQLDAEIARLLDGLGPCYIPAGTQIDTQLDTHGQEIHYTPVATLPSGTVVHND